MVTSESKAFRFGVSSGAFFPVLPTEDAPERTAELGFSELEIMLQTSGEYAPLFSRKLAEAVDRSGVEVHAIHTRQQEHPLFSPYERRRDEGFAQFQRAIDGAARLSAGCVVWHGPSPEELAMPAGIDHLLTVLERLATRCAATGVKLALENTSQFAWPGFREIRALSSRLDELAHGEAVGFAFDPFQAAEAGANPFLVLRAMNGRVLDVHLSDFREGDPDRARLLPGEGSLPWPALLRAIHLSSYSGPLILESSLADRPDSVVTGFLDSWRLSLAHEEVEPCRGVMPAGVLEGIRLFNACQFYECHEVIEQEWHAETQPIRRLYQGILQIGIGFHHARSGNQRGAVALLTDGIDKVSAFLPDCGGIDTARLLEESQEWLDRIATAPAAGLAEFNWSDLPHIATVETTDRSSGGDAETRR